MVLIWPFMTLYGLIWPFMAKYRSDWTCIVFSRGHRSKFIWSCFLLTKKVTKNAIDKIGNDLATLLDAYIVPVQNNS